MAIDLIKLGKCVTDEEFAKIVFSSGDYFPGFYRFTMGDRNHENGQLSLKGLLSAYFDQVATGKLYSKEQWTSYAKKRHEALDPRNASRSDSAVYDLLNDGYLKWMSDATEYDIAVIELDTDFEKLEKNRTYFFMGSMIRITDDKLLLGYDLLRNQTCYEISVNSNELLCYIHDLYDDTLTDFFLPADIIASLTFEKLGQVYMSDESIARALTSEANTICIASNRDVSSLLPIRWAKDILLTEVTEL